MLQAHVSHPSVAAIGYARCCVSERCVRTFHMLLRCGAALPSRAVQVIALVQRCLSASVDESVKSLALHMLQRWRWQLAGHMQVRFPVWLNVPIPCHW
jgi:hypothetical protein